MKKLALALMCAMSVLFFVSCSKTTEVKKPTINFVTDSTVYEGATFECSLDSVFVKVQGTATDKKDLLASLNLNVKIDGVELGDTLINLGNVETFEGGDYMPLMYAGKMTITVTVTTQKGQSATSSINLIINPLEVYPLQWKRIGGNPAEGLDEFGLSWTANLKETHAVIKPVDGAMLFVANEGVDFDEITGIGQAMAVLDQFNMVEDFRGISTTENAEYDYVLASYYLGEIFLINLTNCTLDTSNPFGTIVTIDGQYKSVDFLLF